MQTDRPLLGVMLMLGFCVVAPMGDATAKLLGDRVPLVQLLVLRFGIQAVLLIPLVYWGKRTWRMSGRVLALTLVRTVLHILGIGMMFSALRYLPLADAVAIAFVMPLILLLMGHLFLKETVGWQRLTACFVGFAGTLLVVQPSFEEVGLPALLPLGVAVNFSVFILLTRQIARDTDPIGLQAVSGVAAVVMLLPLLLIIPADLVPGFGWTTPNSVTWELLLAIGVLGTLAHLLMTWSLRYAPSATVAPMQYLEIPIATLIGWVIFGDWPNALAATGIVITIATGLFIVARENQILRRKRA